MTEQRSQHWFNVPLILLFLLALLSAFAVVFTKEVTRRTVMQGEELENLHQQLRVEHGQLLLELSTWSTQDRVQRIAREKLGMKVPQQSDIVLIKQ